MRTMAGVTLWLLTAPFALAAQVDHAHGHHEPGAIKALSAAEVEGLLAGEGMGFAVAAELNHHPGPRHVLDLASELGLSADQNARVQAIFDRMLGRAVATGALYVEAERSLDAFFVDRLFDVSRLEQLTAEAARLRGELRRIHLEAHLQTTELLDSSQIETYDRLRGHAHGPGH